MKEVIGKTKGRQNNFPRRMLINNIETYDKKNIAEGFNDYFVGVGPNLAKNITPSLLSFKSYLKNGNLTMKNELLDESEFTTAFNSLKTNKSNGYDDISSNVVIKIYDEIKTPLFHIFSESLKQGIFPHKLKIAKVTPLFKSGDETYFNNYRPISILPAFSKILERIMYNRVYSYFIKNNFLYKKQFGFQQNCSTDQAILNLIDEICEAFDKKQYMLGVFIDLSKAFDTVDHTILLEKLHMYGVKENIYTWFLSYLSNRMQFVSFDNNKTNLLIIKCGVPQGSILGPLLFLIYVNDLHNASTVLNPIMFADDTNLFYSHKDIKTLFKTVNEELKNIHEWFKANKLSLNVTKTKCSFFHTAKKQDDIPLKLPKLVINETEIKRDSTIKFLGVLLDENISWKPHINLIKDKISRNIGVMYKARAYLNKRCMKQIYFSFIHSYISYANIAWGSTHKSKLIPIYRKQKHACRLIHFATKETHSRPLMQDLNALNIFQINILQSLLFMFKVKYKLAREIFQSQFVLNNMHKYTTRASEYNYQKPFKPTKLGQFSISFRGPQLWNQLNNDESFNITSLPNYRNYIKKLLLSQTNEGQFFN